MYELTILSLLMRWPIHGYLIVKITNDQIGPWARISSGTLYTILGRLEEAGLIAVVTPPDDHTNADHPAPRRNDRRSRTFRITDEGRKRFHQLMMDTSSNLGDYQRFFQYKMGYIDLLRPSERVLLMNHYVNYCQTTILHLQTEMAGLVQELASHPNPAYLRNLLGVMTHIAQQEQAELDWITDVRERELAQQRDQHSSQPGDHDQNMISTSEG